MRILIAAVGKLKSGPERDLCERYLDRAKKSGRALGIMRVEVREWPESRAVRADDRCAEETAVMLAELPAAAKLILLDETGTSPSSTDFAQMISGERDRGISDLVFMIGGPDGHAATSLARADRIISFGAMTWPHQIVRVLLAEQIYRAMTILSGHPYHRA